jgi:hypothetical protein
MATRVASPARSRSRNPSKQGRVDVIRRSEIGTLTVITTPTENDAPRLTQELTAHLRYETTTRLDNDHTAAALITTRGGRIVDHKMVHLPHARRTWVSWLDPFGARGKLVEIFIDGI